MPSVETALVVQSLLGDLVDAEAVAKMGPDPSGVHVPGQLRPVRVRRRAVAKADPGQEPPAWKRNVALATNAGGVLAAPAAIGMAVRSARRNEGGMSREVGRKIAERRPEGRSARIVRTLDNKVGRKGRIGAAVAGGTAITLQAANGTGDFFAAQEMDRQRRVANQRKTVNKAIPLPKLLRGRIASLKNTMGLGGTHGGRSPGKHSGGSLATGLQRNPNPTKPVPGVAIGAVPSNATGPLNAKQVSAMGSAAGARTKVEDFIGHPGGKAALGAVGVAGIYGQGKRKGTEQAYYGKADVVDVGIEGTFSKFDDEKRRAYGWASVVSMDGEPVVDRQGDYIGLEDIEEAAYTYVRKSRVTGDMHRRGLDDTPHKAGELIESVVFTPDKCHAMGLPASFAGKWWMGVQVEDDEVWSEVKKGNRTGFSIHGKGLRKDTTLDDIKAGR